VTAYNVLSDTDKVGAAGVVHGRMLSMHFFFTAPAMSLAQLGGVCHISFARVQ
jgi:hypothetical protein